MRPVELRALMSIYVNVLPLVYLGGGRRFVPFDGGTFEGRDGLAGSIHQGGVDWQTVRPDGTLDIDAHYTLLTDEQEAIEVVSQGLRRASDDVAARLTRGTRWIPTSITSGLWCGCRRRRPACTGSTIWSPCRRVDVTSRSCGSTCTRSCERKEHTAPLCRRGCRDRRPDDGAQPARDRGPGRRVRFGEAAAPPRGGHQPPAPRRPRTRRDWASSTSSVPSRSRRRNSSTARGAVRRSGGKSGVSPPGTHGPRSPCTAVSCRRSCGRH